MSDPAKRHVDHQLIADVRGALAEVADPDRALAMRAYMKSSLPYYGVSMPVLRRVSKRLIDERPPLVRGVWEATVLAMYDGAEHREERYAALVLAGHRCASAWQDPAALVPYRHLVVTGGWWDLVDWVAGQLVSPIRRSYPTAVDPLIRAWATDDDLWLRRTAVLSQLGARGDLDLDLLADCLAPNLERPEFWLRKACGWALREAARSDPGWVLSYVDGHREQMSGLTRREATKHLDQ